MTKIVIMNRVKIRRSARVAAVLGMFEIGRSADSVHEITGEIDLSGDWSIGLIVGPSGSGKSSVARRLFRRELVEGFTWPRDGAVVDGFQKGVSIKDITSALSSVGFSSPPAWLRPFRVLSTGEQFRATIARAMVESGDRFVIDEFTSVVDRTVAKIGSAAVAKAVRRAGKRFVAVSCHYDIVEWLRPDWIFEPHTGRFQKKKRSRDRRLRLTCGASIEALGRCSARITI